MALDNGYHFAAQALPTPTDTPYDSPSMGTSKQPSRQGTSSPFSNYSPIPFPPGEDSYFPKQQGTTDDGNVDRTSANESRRFTPNNLGISLVAQIHSLKKELGNKNTMMESLEESLHKTRAETEQLTKDLKKEKVEVTSVKKQMQSIENDMLQGLEDIAKERDNAVEILADTRKRLEDSRKKVRAQEEDANKARALWEKDRESWDDKKRKLEGKVHTVEERLKTMVAEMLIVHNTGEKTPGIGNDVDAGMQDTWFNEGNDTSSIRTTSCMSNRSLDEPYDSKRISNFRFSRISGLHGLGCSQTSGISLADELKLGEDGDAAEEEDIDQDALPEETYTSMRRYSEDKKARKVMGFHADNNEELLGDETSGHHSMGIINDYIDLPGRQLAVHFTDAGTQFSPPPSPTLQTHGKPVEQIERAANQSRKRIAIPQIFVEQTPAPKATEQKASSQISTGTQTIRQLEEDPASTGTAANETSVPVPLIANEMKSASTQTIDDATPVSEPAGPRLSPSPTDVPVIAIHPPASRPSSSRNSVMLPPRTKSAACQADIELPRNTKSMSMQTEELRIDKRPIKIPPRLSSSDLSTQPPPRLAERRKQAGNTSGPESLKRNLRSPPPIGTDENQPSATTATIKNEYPGNNDNGPLNHTQRSGPSRPIRSESIFAGFDVSSDDDHEKAQYHFSDEEFLNAAPIRKTLSKVQNSWKLVPHLEDSVLERLESASEEAEDEKHVGVPQAAIAKANASSQSTSKTFRTRPAESHRKASINAKQPDMRRKALVSNGIVKHAQRGRSGGSPSKSSVSGYEPTIAPPFPVPTRSSSRVIPLSASDGAASPSPHTTTFFSARHGQKYSRPPTKRKILRKVQSAAAVTQPPIPLRPQPNQSFSASSTVLSSPKSPAPRRNQFILPYDSVAELPSHSAPPQTRAGETLVKTPSEQTSVVDAIAQTMVGEWMWKYVRKRTSFGITESPQAEFEMGRNGDNGNGSGVRHKRWVWLAPYERSVMWSGKQPTSGPALLGKGGRKLAIQSVLDVRDDTPLPKNAGSQTIFNRSILILTPQRALKFTATSRERHYIWLTALSFLSHSTRGMDDLASPSPLPKQEHQHLPQQEPMTRFRRTSIRDSINASKVKNRPSIGAHSYSSPIISIEQEIIQGAIMPWEDEEAELDDAAEPPQVHRVAAHARKRRSTGPRPAPLSALHNYTNNQMAVASSSSLQGPTSREKYDRFTPHPQGGSDPNTRHSTMTRRITESSIVSFPVVPDNFFDSAGTVRMEAFVDRKENEYVLTSRGKSNRTRQGRRKDMNFWGLDAPGASSGLESARVKGEDPFTEF